MKEEDADMNFGGFGFPATKSSGFSKAIPNFSKATAPGFGKSGKPFGKFGKPFGKFGKPFGKFGKGFPASKAGGFSSVVPATSVATSPGFGI
jgi:hypothetical protein